MIAAHRVFRVPGLSSLAAGAQSTPVTFRWSVGGFVIGMIGTVLLTGAVNTNFADGRALSAMCVRIEMGSGRMAPFADDSGSAFVSFFQLHGPTPWQPFPIMRSVSDTETWRIDFLNRDGTLAFTPDLAFHWAASPPPGWQPLPGLGG